MPAPRKKRGARSGLLSFDTQSFLDSPGITKTIVEYPPLSIIFAQGDPCDAVMYVQKGTVKLSVLSRGGKEAVVAMLGRGDFLGEGALAGQRVRMATATAVSASTLLIVPKAQMIQLLRDEASFSNRFITFMLARNIRIEEDLVDQFSTRAKSAWRARCCCWPGTAWKTGPRERCLTCLRRLLPK